MPNLPSAEKRMRQDVIRKARNRWRLRTMRTALKDFHEKLLHGSYSDAETSFRVCSKVIDKNAQKGVIHRNQASRRKSRLSARLLAKKKA